MIDSDVNIPGNVNAYLTGRGFGGGMVIDLRRDGLPPGKNRKGPNGKPLEWIPRDGSVVIDGKPSSTGGLLPTEMTRDISTAAESLARLSARLEAFFTPPTATQPATTTAPAKPPTIFTTLAKLNRALDAFNETLGDPENQAKIKSSLIKLDTALGNFNEAARAPATPWPTPGNSSPAPKAPSATSPAAAKTSAKRFDELALKLMNDADQLNKVLTSLHHSAVKLESSDGTAGKLLNDAKLYNNLVEATDQLTATLKDLSSLLDKWKKNGVDMKLK